MSGVYRLMPVSRLPVSGLSGGGGASAIVVSPPAGPTSTHRYWPPNGRSTRFSNPSFST